MSAAQIVINMSTVPPVVWLDTPERRAVAEQVLQRSIYGLRKLQERGLKIHKMPGKTENGDRYFIVVAEYVKFLQTISEEAHTEMKGD